MTTYYLIGGSSMDRPGISPPRNPSQLREEARTRQRAFQAQCQPILDEMEQVMRYATIARIKQIGTLGGGALVITYDPHTERRLAALRQALEDVKRAFAERHTHGDTDDDLG